MTAFVILGAGGDLTARYLMPALNELDAAGALPAELTIIGVDRNEWTDEEFRRRVAPQLASTNPRFLAKLRYHRGDVTDAASLRAAFVPAGSPAVVYLALPPQVVPAAVTALGALPLPRRSRIVAEKPFGHDARSARALNELLQDVVAEDHVFRVDHFLGKQTVQNVLGVRFANRVFEAVWNADHVESVEVVWDETLALEGRAGYYDRAGALRDMVQNHLLQLLCLLAMEPPSSLDERSLRDRKVDVLRAVRRPTIGDVRNHTVRARYGAGSVGGRALPAYVDEPGVVAERGTETFAAVTLFVDNRRWTGVPFTLRTGKALAADRFEIRIRFRPVAHLAFDGAHEPEPNVLVLRLAPDAVTLELNLNGAGDPFVLERCALSASLAPQEMSAYARLLVDVFAGDPILSIRADEAEEAWRIVEPILDGWAAGAAPLLEYAAGSAGPTPQPSG